SLLYLEIVNSSFVVSLFLQLVNSLVHLLCIFYLTSNFVSPIFVSHFISLDNIKPEMINAHGHVLPALFRVIEENDEIIRQRGCYALSALSFPFSFCLLYLSHFS